MLKQLKMRIKPLVGEFKQMDKDNKSKKTPYGVKYIK